MIDEKTLIERTIQLIHEVLQTKGIDEGLRLKLVNLRDDAEWLLENGENSVQ